MGLTFAPKTVYSRRRRSARRCTARGGGPLAARGSRAGAAHTRNRFHECQADFCTVRNVSQWGQKYLSRLPMDPKKRFYPPRYDIPIGRGMYTEVPRTGGISTTELIDRVRTCARMTAARGDAHAEVMRTLRPAMRTRGRRCARTLLMRTLLVRRSRLG